MNTKLLEEIGLTESEAKIYFALLELGSSSTGPIVEKSGVASSKVYELLEKLSSKGLVSVFVESGVKHFEAASPQRIMDYLKEKKVTLDLQEKEIQKLLPELELKRTLAKYKTEATVFRGMKGLETAFEDVFKVLKKGDIVYTFIVGDLDDRLTTFFVRQYVKRKKVGIKSKTIFSEAGRKSYNARDLSTFEGKILTHAATSPATINIYGQKVIMRIGNSEEVIAIMINNKNLAESFMQQFNALWNQDVSVVKGIPALTLALDKYLNGLQPGESYNVLGATFGVKDYSFYKKEYADAFKKIHEKRTEKGIGARLLFQQRDPSMINTFLEEVYCKKNEAKILPYKTKFPVAILPSQQQTLIIVHEKEPSMITINNKEVSGAFQKYFDELWNQNTIVVRGYDAIQKLFEETLDAQELDFIGARGYFIDNRSKFIDWWEKQAIQKGLKMRNIVDIETKGHRITTFPFAETRYSIPKEYSNLSVFWIYNNKVVISNYMQKEPFALVIENKELYALYKEQFNALWNQDVVVHKGVDHIQATWNMMLDELQSGEEYFVLGASWQGQTKQIQDFFIDFHTRRIQKKVHAKFLFVSGTQDMLSQHKKLYYTLSQFKFLPYTVYEGMQINLYHNKVLMFVWREKDPLVFVINDPIVYKTFKAYFDTLWMSSAEK
ncbi:MAG: helix-turn-helix domain-containing protein [Candidatus Woesearchaeota archaeon]|jgi:sugar-specific transcriptional regulator TrmB